MEGGHLAVQRNGFDNQIHRDVVAADSQSENTKQMQCMSMTGIDLQNLSIEPFCFVQEAGLVVPKGISEHVLNARWCPLRHGPSPALLVFHPALFAVHLS
jgi:hypothetical protein